MAHRDFEQPELTELNWLGPDRAESLAAVYRHAVNSAKEVEGWYAQRRRAKRPWGRALRVGAIVLAGIAAILPVISEITGDGGSSVAPAWSTVALAGAAILIALDRFFGFSSAWMRYMETDLRVQHLRHDFEYAWQAARVNQADPPPDDEVNTLLTLARGFAAAVDEAVEEETGAWLKEFRATLEGTGENVAAPNQT